MADTPTESARLTSERNPPASRGREGSTAGEPLVGLAAPEVLPILLVDRGEHLERLEAALSSLELPLEKASSEEEALALLRERVFSLILLDVETPGLDGAKTVRSIKELERTRETPIVLLTAAGSDPQDLLRAYGTQAVDYVSEPFDPEVLRRKVALFAELESSRRALTRSESFLRGAFDAAPVGKTVLDQDLRIIRSNPAFARMVGHSPSELQGVSVADLCHPDDSATLTEALNRVAAETGETRAPEHDVIDLRLRSSTDSEVWVGLVASSIEPTGSGEALLLAQWVDLTTRHRAEQARAQLLLEQTARAQAEATAERVTKLQALADATESLSLNELLPELALQVADLLSVDIAEVGIRDEWGVPLIVRATGGETERLERDAPPPEGYGWQEVMLHIERTTIGALRLGLKEGDSLTAGQRSLLRDAAERAALSIRRAQLHEEEHRIAVELQRGLIPQRLPAVPGIELAAHYEPAGLTAQVGGDWYDAFELPDGRLGIVLGDVAGKGIPAASTMGQLRGVTRAFALADLGERDPAEVLTRLNRHQLMLDEDSLFTVIYALIDARAGTLTWANAGHPPPLLRAAAGQSTYLGGRDELMSLGDVTYTSHHHSLASGDSLIFYTDGLLERRNEPLDAGLGRLRDAADSGPRDAGALCAHIQRKLLPADARLDDDVTAVVVRIAP